MATINSDVSILAEQTDNGDKLVISDASDWWGSKAITDVTNVKLTIEYNSGYTSSGYSTLGSEITFDCSSVDDTEDLVFTVELNSDDNLIIYWNGDTADTTTLVSSYSSDYLKDGMWRITYKITITGDDEYTSTSPFVYLLNYEDKLYLYEDFAELPNKYTSDSIAYDEDVESNLLNYAFLKAEEFAASQGQIEMVGDIQTTLKSLLGITSS